jgi:hypothetical protein
MFAVRLADVRYGLQVVGRLRGHPLSGDNLRIGPNGARACRACNVAAQRAFVSATAPPDPLALIAYKDRYVN